MSNYEEKNRVPKLEHGNWLYWSGMVSGILRAKGMKLWRVTEGKLTPPEIPTQPVASATETPTEDEAKAREKSWKTTLKEFEEEQDTYEGYHATATELIRRGLAPKVATRYVNILRADELWNALKQSYGMTTSRTRQSKLIEYDSLKQGSGTVVQFFQTLEVKFSELMQIGGIAMDVDRMLGPVLMYDGLHPDYAPYLQGWGELVIQLTERFQAQNGDFGRSADFGGLTADNLDYIFDSIKERAQAAETARLIKKRSKVAVNAPATTEEIALVANGQGGNNRGGGRGGGRGGRGKAKGRGGGTTASTDRKADLSKVQCYRCDQYGHLSRDCPTRNNNGGDSGGGEGGNSNHAMAATRATAAQLRNHWVSDSGSKHHLTPHASDFIAGTLRKDDGVVTIGDGKQLQITGIGSVLLRARDGNDGVHNVTLNNVRLVPGLKYRLLSERMAVTQSPTLQIVRTATGTVYSHRDTPTKVVLRCRIVDGCEVADVVQRLDGGVAMPTMAPVPTELTLWHHRLGHVATRAIKSTLGEQAPATAQMATSAGEQAVAQPDAGEQAAAPSTGNGKTAAPCKTCLEGGQIRDTFAPSDRKSTVPLQLVHSDVVGPLPATFAGKRYMVTFADDATGFVAIHLLSQKSDVFEAFKTYIAWAERSSGQRLKAFRTDGGGEYVNGKFADYFKTTGVEHQQTQAYSPPQNGVAERLNRTLPEMVRTWLVHCKGTQALWGEAITLACWVHNRILRSRQASPYALWYKVPQATAAKELQQLRVFGCLAYVKENGPRRKLDAKATPAIFVGFDANRRGWRFLDPANGYKVLHGRDAQFVEAQTWADLRRSQNHDGVGNAEPTHAQEEHAQEEQAAESDDDDASVAWPEWRDAIRPTGDTQQKEVLQMADKDGTEDGTDDGNHTADSSELSDAPDSDGGAEGGGEAVRSSGRPARQTQTPVRLNDYVHLALVANVVEGDHAELADPTSVEEARKRPDWPKWLKAIQAELENHRVNGTWRLSALPAGRTPIGAKWVLVRKRNADGSIDRYKARLVARGFSQRANIDYDAAAIYSPVVKPSTIRVVVAIAVRFGWPVHHMDVVAAYLNSTLDEEVYMLQPPGFGDASGRVCRLQKGIYGLKQSGRQWYYTAHRALQTLGYLRVHGDYGLYHRTSQNGDRVILCLYVDDIVITASSRKILSQAKAALTERFKMTDSGEVSFLLGMRFTWTDRTLTVDQETYGTTVVKRFLGDGAGTFGTRTALPSGYSLTHADEGELLADPTEYRAAVGSLMYSAMGTRPDLMFAVQLHARRMHTPTERHWQAVLHSIRYLKQTYSQRLVFRRGATERTEGLRVYTDADYSGDYETARSTSGLLVTVGGSPILWSSRLQNVTAQSTLESEYIAANDAAREVAWLRAVLTALRLPANLTDNAPTPVLCDNTAALAFAQETRHHRRTRHINVRYHYVRDCRADGLIRLEYIPSAQQKADVLTKPLNRRLTEMAIAALTPE